MHSNEKNRVETYLKNKFPESTIQLIEKPESVKVTWESNFDTFTIHVFNDGSIEMEIHDGEEDDVTRFKNIDEFLKKSKFS